MRGAIRGREGLVKGNGEGADLRPRKRVVWGAIRGREGLVEGEGTTEDPFRKRLGACFETRRADPRVPRRSETTINKPG